MLPRVPRGYGLVLVLILVSTFLAAVDAPNAAVRIGSVLARGGTLLAVLATVRARRRTIVAVAWLVVAGVLATANVAPGVTEPAWAASAVDALLVAAAPVLILRELTEHPVVDAQTLLGVLCVYLLLGLFFASVYDVLATAAPQPLFATGDGSRADHLYFSLITLTTVGYGDLVPVPDLARTIAALEALMGQLYLVTIVALVVSRLGHERPPRHRPPSE